MPQKQIPPKLRGAPDTTAGPEWLSIPAALAWLQARGIDRTAKHLADPRNGRLRRRYDYQTGQLQVSLADLERYASDPPRRGRKRKPTEADELRAALADVLAWLDSTDAYVPRVAAIARARKLLKGGAK